LSLPITFLLLAFAAALETFIKNMDEGQSSRLSRTIGWVTTVLFWVAVIGSVIALLAMFVATFGYSYIFIPNPWTSFKFWRTYGAVCGYLVPFGLLFLYWTVRDAATSGGTARKVISTLWMGLVAIVTFIVLMAVVAYLSMCMAVLGIKDFADCSNRLLCSGYDNGVPSGGNKPSAGAIMMMVGWGVTILIALGGMILAVILMLLVRRSQINALVRRSRQGALKFTQGLADGFDPENEGGGFESIDGDIAGSADEDY
jgi:hypothetical protein